MHEYQHKIPTLSNHVLQKGDLKDYGAKNLWASNKSDKHILPPEYRKYIQQVVGKLLYGARAVEPSMLVALITLSSEKAKGKRRHQISSGPFT